MQRRLLPLLALLALLATALAVPGSASAKSRYKVGLGDQSFLMFGDSGFNSLKIKQVRLIVPWDWNNKASDPGSIKAWLGAAKADKKSVLVAFSAHRGCYNNGKYSKQTVCKAPSIKAYTKSVKAFRKAYPQVTQFQPWNELNNKSQPTYKSPKLAGNYYIALKKTCKKCTVVAADILDASNMVRYVKGVRSTIERYARKHKGFAKPRLWGLHNYSDVNRSRTVQTKQFLRAVPGKVWLTETGGLVKFLPHFKNSPARAAKATKFLFRLADRFSRKHKGQSTTIARVYQYSYYGYLVAPGQKNVQPRFDSGLTGVVLLDATFNKIAGTGKGRKGYSVFKKLVKTKSK
jgi:hypothetical protein